MADLLPVLAREQVGFRRHASVRAKEPFYACLVTGIRFQGQQHCLVLRVTGDELAADRGTFPGPVHLAQQYPRTVSIGLLEKPRTFGGAFLSGGTQPTQET